MKDFLKQFKASLRKDDRVNFRDRRAHYASDANGCLRDLYWKRTGVKPTNRPDVVSKLKMSYGSAIGDYAARVILGNMLDEGYILMKAEAPAGGSDPDINCYLDAIMSRPLDGTLTGPREHFVVEIKTASGYGANLLAQSFAPKEGYLIQLGIYLKDLHSKGVTSKGCLFYFLLSDKCVGQVVMVSCYYDPATDEIVAYKGENSNGDLRSLDIKFRVGAAEERLRKLDTFLKEGQVPPADFVYKYEVTPENVATWTDNDLLKALRDGTVKGDWQVKYSNYKDLQLETDGVSLGYSDEELGIIKKEKKRRTPNSKYVK